MTGSRRTTLGCETQVCGTASARHTLELMEEEHVNFAGLAIALATAVVHDDSEALS